MTLRSVATTALAVLRDLHGDGIDVSDVIAVLDRALHGAPKVQRPPRNRWGFRRGEPLRVTRGRLAGCTVEFVRACSSRQVYVRFNGGLFAVQVQYVERAT
jgi:hypothetical protein